MFGHKNRTGIQPKMLDPDPDQMNADLQPCNLVFGLPVGFRVDQDPDQSLFLTNM